MPCWIWDFLFSLEKKVVVVDPCLIDPWHQKKVTTWRILRKDLLRKAKSVWIFILDHQCFKSPATYIYLSSFGTIIISRKIQWWDGWITEKSPGQLVNYQTSISFSWILCLPFCGSHDSRLYRWTFSNVMREGLLKSYATGVPWLLPCSWNNMKMTVSWNIA